MKISLAISTCPNDTFAFHGLMSREVDWDGFEFEIQLLDIEQLNQGLFADQFDVAKCSYHAALLLADRYRMLSAGSALGFGVGPLLLSNCLEAIEINAAAAGDADAVRSFEQRRGRKPIVLCPGAHTTATMLYRVLQPYPSEIRQVVFSEIMPALQANEADFGVCIHEGRFTWQTSGLGLVADLGTEWEQRTAQPLPLGGLIGRQDLGVDSLRRVNRVIRNSIEFGLANRQAALPTMKKYAQELSAEVIFSHVDLYVNEWTVDLGDQGWAAVESLNQLARASGLVAAGCPTLQIVSAG